MASRAGKFYLTLIPALLLLCAFWLPHPCLAAGSADGVETAAAEAAVRSPGAALVEIEGFADGGGDIPCGKKSYSNSWHYKFHTASVSGWLLVNACGGGFFNAATHFPGNLAAEPREKLPASTADSVEVMAELKEKGYFRGAAGSAARDVYMRAAMYRAENGRPAGCYWQVSRGREKVFMDCGLERAWGPAAPKAAGAAAQALPAGTAARRDKDADTAGKYLARAAALANRTASGYTLRAVEGMSDAGGRAKCLGPDDGWIFVFARRGDSTARLIGACKDKVADLGPDLSGKNRDAAAAPDLPGAFKDSDEAMAGLASACRGSTAVARLQTFSGGQATAGHGFLWRIDCGAERHFVDAYTGRYAGRAEKPRAGESRGGF